MSGWYDIGKEELLSRVIPDTAGVWVLGVNSDYVYNPGQTEVALLDPYTVLPAQQLTTVTFTGGVLDADDVQWIAAGANPAPGDNLNLLGVIIFFAQDDTATLLAFIDAAVVGLPQTLTGVNVTAKWDAAGILRL